MISVMRDLLSGFMLLVLSVVAVPTGQAQGSPADGSHPSEGSTFVLVHGGFAGGWVWQDIADRLRSAGQDVYTPTLTGLGERAHLGTPDVGLGTHVQDVVAVLEYEALQDVVLVGHSYGGFVVARSVERARERGWTVHEVEAAHMGIWTHSAAVAEVLLSVAGH